MALTMTTAAASQQQQSFTHEEEETANGTPKRYVPLHHVYSATVPCVSASGSSNVMSKKVKARKIVVDSAFPDEDDGGGESEQKKKIEPFLRVYERKRKRNLCGLKELEAKTSVCAKVEVEEVEEEEGKVRILKKGKRNCELVNLGVEGLSPPLLDCTRPRGRRGSTSSSVGTDVRRRKRKVKSECEGTGSVKASGGSSKRRKWVELSFKDADLNTFINLSCKTRWLQVYWPLDDKWYQGKIVAYDSQKQEHKVKYEDGDVESLTFSREKIKFHVCEDEMELFKLKPFLTKEENILDYDEMAALAANFDDCQELEPGDLIWAKLTGHAMWPAVVVSESITDACKRLKSSNGEKSVSVQFFGTHDFARIKMKQVISFLKGLIASFHLKCKRNHFHQSLEEAKAYLTEQKLPDEMQKLQNKIGVGACESSSAEEDASGGSIGDREEDRAERVLEHHQTFPFKIRDLRIMSLGNVVTDSKYFNNERHIWPEGYTVIRKFVSVLDPSGHGSYMMEVLRDPETKVKPLFRVTMDKKVQFTGSTPSACWNKIYKRIRKKRGSTSSACHTKGRIESFEKSGSYMFGFTNRKISHLIQELSYSIMPSMYSGLKFASKKYGNLHHGYRPVRIGWKDLDRCNVCHMDEEYEDNLFLQCDKCRMMVHARCYGELEPLDGALWKCNICREGAECPPCCLCPVLGGAMKQTTDGRWAHLACAIWIPETCLSDIKRMEPIDGLDRVNKDRWKLLCSICGVHYGACIQCSNITCRVAYHPLCARVAGLCVELEDEDKLHLMSFDEDEDDQCIRLLSYCKKHRSPSNERLPTADQIGSVIPQCSNFTPPCNSSGCARTEPYDFLGRRGRKEPDALAAASLKRLYVENKPYLVTGYCQNKTKEDANITCGDTHKGKDDACKTKEDASLSNESLELSDPSGEPKPSASQLGTRERKQYIADKYNHMRETFRKRLAFGKSRIHGFGIFAKLPHRAGDMVIEYTGEVVRPSVADRREHLIYNSLVGAGTYMFRVDDERVVDATRAGSIAHLINHSCEPNCYSRVISVHGDEHIIIFAKRDIVQWEELTYDYRFFSIDERLSCYCGFPRCRGIVNDIDTEEQAAKLYVPQSKLIDWQEE
ncbi:hypothetical protein Sjap_009202 [Stephania japonica]|uniref:Histone-lysine N-methyltransferase ATX2 n=1 Tax=Stephania japonica TaxID=461633 RepID=A0AAP0PBJ0_9MAGN